MRHLELIEQASRAKTEFLANINHEFRTPLNSIDGNLQLLNRTSPLTDRQKELIQRMRLAVTALMSLLKEVLDYAKLEQHKYTLNPENFSLRLCIQESVDVMAAHTTNKKNKIYFHFALDVSNFTYTFTNNQTLTFPPKVPTVVFGDSWQLQKVLVNLLSNANRFTEQGVIHINVAVDYSSDTTRSLRFDVTDTGCGIDEETQKDLFKPWVQSSTLSKGPDKGTGLGLAICKELCTLMGGSIWLHHTSTEKDTHGTTFSFLLPLVSVEGSSQLTTFHTEIETLKGKRILLLYPDGEDRKQLVKSILSWGMFLTSTSSPEEARHFFEAGYKFDVAFLGIQSGPCPGAVSVKDENDLIGLAQWISETHPQLPLMLIGDDTNCFQLFRKVIEPPIKPEEVFHLCVNLFSGDGTKTHKKPTPNNSANLLKDQQHVNHTCKCLIVEDVKENEVVLREMLQELGHSVGESVTNGKEMLDVLKEENDYDVVFLDILMPVMNGLDAIKEYRKTHDMNTKPYIVAVSASTLITTENDQHKQQGMDAFLRKPVKLNELKTLMDVIARNKK